MKTVFLAAAACAALVLFAEDVRAFRPNDSGGDSNNSSNFSDKRNQNSNNSDNSNSNNSNSNTPEKFKNQNLKNKQNSNQESNNNMGRGSFIQRNQSLGDSKYDKNHVGAMDESKYKDRKDNDWRYRHWGREWWYWVPDGYWMYWHDGRWVRYNVDSYVNSENFNGPYYEDENGFYSMQNGRRVYDQQIRRVAN